MAVGRGYRNGVIPGLHRPWGTPTSLGVPMLTAAAAAAAGALVVHTPAVALAVVGLVVVVTYMGETARRPLGEVLLVGMIVLAGVVDILQRIDAGAASGQAVETVALVLLALLVCLTGITVPAGAAGRALGVVALFVIWTLVSFTWGTVSTQGLQNVFVYIGGGAVHGDRRDRRAPSRGRPRTRSSRARSGWRRHRPRAVRDQRGDRRPGYEQDHLAAPVRPDGGRDGGLVHGRSADRAAAGRAGWWLFAIGLTLLSLSRSALAAEFVLLALARSQPGQLPRLDDRHRRDGRHGGDRALAAVFLYAPLHHRFFHGDTPRVGGFSINVTGRDALWAANWGWFKERPLIGHGAGASDRMTAALPNHGAGHPHNDYLRILVDYGIIGFVLWMTAYLVAAAADLEAVAGGAGDARLCGADPCCRVPACWSASASR